MFRFFLCMLMLFVCCKKENQIIEERKLYSSETQIEPEWKVEYYSEKPDSIDLKVTYQEKYGLERVVFCKAVFSNSKTNQYKLISPEVSLILEKSNLISLKVEKITITSDR